MGAFPVLRRRPAAATLQADPSGAGYNAIVMALNALVAAQFPSGNLPSSLGKDTDK
jgi:hypothetical protein